MVVSRESRNGRRSSLPETLDRSRDLQHLPSVGTLGQLFPYGIFAALESRRSMISGGLQHVGKRFEQQ